MLEGRRREPTRAGLGCAVGVWVGVEAGQTLEKDSGEFSNSVVPLCLPLLEGTFPIDVQLSTGPKPLL